MIFKHPPLLSSLNPQFGQEEALELISLLHSWHLIKAIRICLVFNSLLHSIEVFDLRLFLGGTEN